MSGTMDFTASTRCRVCLQYQYNIFRLDSVVTVLDEKVLLSHILVSCCAVEILDDDKKPHTLCTQCAQDAEIAYKFKQTVEQADLTLQYELDNMMNVHVKEEEIDIDEGENMTIEGDSKGGTTVPIKDEPTYRVSLSYNDDLNQLKFEQINIETIICKVCQMCFADWVSLKHHLENCHIRVCGQTFTSSEALDGHILTHEVPSTCKELVIKQRKKLVSHKCRFCKMSYKFPAELRNHLMTHTAVKHYLCSYCGNKFSLFHGSNCERTHTQHSHRHININKKSENNKARHSLNIESRFGCSVCKKKYRWKKSLINHKCVNTSKKPNKCSQCSKEFASIAGLKQHARTHTGEKLYECSHCSKCYTQKGYLTVHERSHTGEKPYECSYCSKRFVRQTHLTDHKRTHTGEKPYECSHCSKRFAHNSTLNRHTRIHTGEKPYQCSHCSKRFTDQSTLITHIRLHTGEKPYQCSHCSKCFTQQGALTNHERTHIRQKAYECSHCNKRFSHHRTLISHRRIHTDG